MRHVMGPFGDEEDAEVVGDVVDGQVIGSSSPQSQQAPPQQFTPAMAAQGRGIVVLKFDPSSQQPAAPIDITDEFLAAATNQRARAFALFIEVPFLAYVALNREMPGLVRVGAAALGVMRALEVTERQQELEQYLNEVVT